ncbi:leucine--tRNA ligase [Thermaurantimonas aggregans]|uniref:Leucine--tRNA ligase n=1 Tax=Thermaurantimonas aggregans TaxID=2173829 RepID=A0A401XM55_9FLAO|nr:leucine--tRNA ligase [Thermaurantimonas aggregans]MCX8148095.1 leucine--tRNA ligase [Thermaurantimonas aggregans]GCD78082.1 leucine--tRNA ligase [Thermaurantimonas aggregans]
MEYNHRDIEKRWVEYWRTHRLYETKEDPSKPKYYVLDMFPYPSGAGLHVGHPLGYIASDIYARYKRHKGYNVLHPMGYDSFGLPAEQYAIQTGQHPAITTERNIQRYRQQLDQLGLSYDWSREVRTSDPAYYKWTQWIFLKFFDSWYNKDTDKAEHIQSLIAHFEKNGTHGLNAACTEPLEFSAQDWANFSEEKKQEILLNYRLAYRSESVVNWCPALGTVLANDEVKDGLSERGGHPVEQKKMMQWSLRISAYAQRLLNGLDTIDWSEALKESQRNWIGRSEGALIQFATDQGPNITVFTTRPDTLFGSTFLVLAPEHELVDAITTDAYRADVEAYRSYVKSRSERDRMADVKTVTGQFTGCYAIHPFTGEKLPVYIAEYVLAGYGTGAIMAVPAHDGRDHRFALKFQLPIRQVIEPGFDWDFSKEAYEEKVGTSVNSDFISGLQVPQAIQRMIEELVARGIGQRKVNFRLRDAVFGRQRYWGEPIPIYYKNGIPYPLPVDKLPLELPTIDKYLPTEEGEPPLARAQNWHYTDEDGNRWPLETTTMPGWAGSSWYYLRYMDPHNPNAPFSKEAELYWQNVDLYMGGSEHATGHLLYARFWHKFLYDLGYVSTEEPFQKLINQGMIQGMSAFVYRIKGEKRFVTYSKKDQFDTQALHVDVSLVENNTLNIDAFKQWRSEYADYEFITEDDGSYKVGREVEKMSKSKYNVINPDDIVEKYGADTLRVYEMFLGPIELSKPWNTDGITGVYNFLRKYWRLHFDPKGNFSVTDDEPTREELKILHKTIKKVTLDIENFSYNTCVSAFMICVNELSALKCNKMQILEPLAVLLAPFAPHVAEECYQKMRPGESVLLAPWPIWDEQILVENTFEYPVSFNGKTRFNLLLSKTLSPKEIEEAVLAEPKTAKYLDGKTPKKVIVVPGRIINIVV